MTQYESRTAQVAYPARTVYDFLSDFSHFEHLLPEEQLEKWTTDGDSCSFEVAGVGKVGLKMEEKTPYERIKITGDSSAGIKFFLSIHIAETGPDHSNVRLVLQADLNIFIRALAEKPLKQFLEMLAGHIETFDFESGNPQSI